MSAAAKSAYAPAPGTTAYRALAHLESLLPGAELMTSALAEAIGVSPLNVGPCLEPALKHGLVFRRQRDNHARSPFWWSLQDHAARPKADIRQPAVPDAGDPYGVPCGFVPRAEREGAAAAAGGSATTEETIHLGNVWTRAAVRADVEDDVATLDGGEPPPLKGRTATVSMTGEVAIVAECGTVVLFDAERARQLLEFCARVCE